MREISSEVARELQTKETGWNMGSFGAIAEFHHVAGDSIPKSDTPLTISTHRGGARFYNLDNVRPVAFESLSAKPHRWTQGVALCLPHQDALMNGRDSLTELGPDEKAIRDHDKDAILFDMGLGQLQVDFCIRTANPDLIYVLRANEGKSIFARDNNAMGAILDANPHRIAVTKIGRIEVYQMIGGAATNGKSPIGPHTHVLPKLLRAGRSHAANVPIPEACLPCGFYHPKSPVVDQLGEDIGFDETAFDAFQRVLAAWGPDGYMLAKQNVWRALSSNESPPQVPGSLNRLSRVATRNALRQWRRKEGDSRLLRDWRQRYDRGNEDIAPENPGH